METMGRDYSNDQKSAIFTRERSELSIYSSESRSLNTTVTIREIYQQVQSQITQFMSAEIDEIANNKRRQPPYTKKSSENTFVPLKALCEVDCKNQIPQKCETQNFATDTQLIELVEGAEAELNFGDQSTDSHDEALTQDTSVDLPTSPILTKRQNLAQNITVDLEVFESFEKVAHNLLNSVNNESLSQESIFVGFISASNKPIEVLSESYDKAVESFSDLDLTDLNQASDDEDDNECKFDRAFQDSEAFPVDTEAFTQNKSFEYCERFTADKKEKDCNVIQSPHTMKIEEELLKEKIQLDVLEQFAVTRNQFIDERNVILPGAVRERHHIASEKCEQFPPLIERNDDVSNNISNQTIQKDSLNQTTPIENDAFSDEIDEEQFSNLADSINKCNVITTINEPDVVEHISRGFTELKSSDPIENHNNHIENTDSCLKVCSQLLEIDVDFFDDIESAEFDNNFPHKNGHEVQEGNNKIQSFHINSTDASTFKGFVTASKKAIQISDKSLSKAKLFINNIQNDLDKTEESNNDSLQHYFQNDKVLLKDLESKCKNSAQIYGFKTASNEDMSLSDLKKAEHPYNDSEFLKQNTTITGNKSPCNKTLDVCSNPNKKVGNGLQDIENKPHKNHNTVKLLQTANNKDIFMSENTLDAAKDTEMEPIINQSQIYHKNTKFQLYKLPNLLDEFGRFEGFKTAANKKIVISDQALQKAKHLVHDYIEELDITDNDSLKQNRTKNDFGIFKGFKTASNKKVVISEQALQKAKQKLDDSEFSTSVNKPLIQEHSGLKIDYTEELDITDNDCLKHNHTKNDIGGFEGFKTASNKKVVISEQALQKAKRKLEENEFSSPVNKALIQEFTGLKTDNIEEPDIIDDDPLKQNPTKNDFGIFKGFKTASNKKVVISEQALQKAKQKMEENEFSSPVNKPLIQEHSGLKMDYTEELDITDNDCLKHNPTKNDIGGFEGFKTASNKKVVISEQALQKAKQKLEENEFSSPVNKALIQEFIGLKTDNIEEPGIIDNDPLKQNPTKNDFGIFKGFKTASNKKVVISEQALQKAKQKLEENEFSSPVNKPLIQEHSGLKMDYTEELDITDNDCVKHNPTKNDIGGFEGFKTASNKKVVISEQALQKAKQKLEENEFSAPLNKKLIQEYSGLNINNIEKLDVAYYDFLKQNPANNDIGRFEGFKTAGNKKVIISQQALQKPEQIFNKHEFSSSMNKALIQECSSSVTEKNEQPNILDDESMKKDSASNDFGMFQGLKTAGKKTIVISEHALQKAQRFDTERKKRANLDKSVDQSNDLKLTSDVTKAKNTINQGLKTASNQIFNAATGKQNLNDTIKDVFGIDISAAFKTNLKKEFLTSKDVIAKAKNQLKKLDECTSHLYIDKFGFLGLQNAVNKGRKRKEFLEENKPKNVYEQSKGKNLGPHYKQNNFGFLLLDTSKTAGNANVKISEAAVVNPKQIVSNVKLCEKITEVVSVPHSTGNSIRVTNVLKDANNIKNYIDTQEIAEFTEDMKETLRSGSPILNCPSAKKRKPQFKAPYRKGAKRIKMNPLQTKEMRKDCAKYTFDEHYKLNKLFTLNEVHKYKSEEEFANLGDFDAHNVIFHGNRNDITDTPMTLENLKMLFLNSVDENIVPDRWFENHITEIIFKLLNYERKFPKIFNNLTSARSVLEQLKYRYDVELENCKRPILRKILEQDAPSSQTMILYISGVYGDDEKSKEIEVSDGWYRLRATIDEVLKKAVQEGKLKIGTKVITSLAELVNCEQGISPFEDTSSVRLKLHGNCTRRVLWHTKLGACPAIPAHMWSIIGTVPRSGPIPKVLVRITRRYPMLHVERMADQSTVTRSDRMELLYSTAKELEREKYLEKIYEKIEKEALSEESCSDDSEPLISDFTNKKRRLETGAQIAKFLKNASDTQDIRSLLTSSQTHIFNEHNMRKREERARRLDERLREEISKMADYTRNVVQLLKVRCVAVDRHKTIRKCMLSIWKPSERVSELIQEGDWIELSNVMPTGQRMDELQISAGRQSMFSKAKRKPSEELTDSYLRRFFPIEELVKNPGTSYDEVDTVGVVVQINDGVPFQSVYLSDSAQNIIIVIFWRGIEKFGYEKILEHGNIVACSNMQRRAGNTLKKYPQFRATEYTTFTNSPRNDVLKRQLDLFKKDLIDVDLKEFCNDCNTSITLNESNLMKSRNFSNISEHNFTKNAQFIETPKNSHMNLSGLDFDSTFKQTQHERNKQKLHKLKQYGEPPALTSISLLNKSLDVVQPFKNPLNSNDSSCKTPPKLDRSKSYQSEFDDDFNCSLPLSLE